MSDILEYTIRRQAEIPADLPREVGEVHTVSMCRTRKELQGKIKELQRLRGLPRGSRRVNILHRTIGGSE